ncbi:MAG: hypothetical protein Q9184_004122 [Pyrenodesmia sp. 2 TL-2023]
MHSSSTLLQLLRQLRPIHYIKASPPLSRQRLFSHRAASAIPPIRWAIPLGGRLSPTLNNSLNRLFHSPSHYLSSYAPPVPTTDPSTSPSPPNDQPQYQLTFTCKPCSNRSTHAISKHGYHKGSVLVACPCCKNRHVVSDHLKIFSDKRTTLEDIMREKGELVKRGRVGVDGEDVEFYPTDEEGERKVLE